MRYDSKEAMLEDGIRQVIAQVSGGAASVVTWFRLLEICEPEISVHGVFADTNSESDELYRFLNDSQRGIGRPLIRLGNDGDTKWGAIHKAGMMKAPNHGCIASHRLKQIPLDNFAKNFSPRDTVRALGMCFDEDDRMVRAEKRLAPYPVTFPLCWSPILTHCDCLADLMRRGIEPSNVYSEGQWHDNCDGGCILGGIEYWTHRLTSYPEKFAEDERQERRFNWDLFNAGRKCHTILRDRRGGTTGNYSLSQLRKDVEWGKRLPKENYGAVCNCMSYAAGSGEHAIEAAKSAAGGVE